MDTKGDTVRQSCDKEKMSTDGEMAAQSERERTAQSRPFDSRTRFVSHQKGKDPGQDRRQSHCQDRG
ncbi:hypothetical protein PAMP_008696 [Pampus punctatissimus]